MIPAYCPYDVPPGERAVYLALQQSEASRDWIVLHSLGIAHHVRQVEGEADFVVIVPDVGIAVIEVKSHLTIDRLDDGTWKLGNGAPTPRSPFRQANEAMYSLREYLQKMRVDLSSIPMISAVWFTGVRARTMLPANPEWHEWQVLDSEDLKSVPGAILRTLGEGTRHLTKKFRNFLYGGVGPETDIAQRIAGLLRPRIELATVAGDRRRARESHLASFIEEQFLALDAAADNRSVLFTGPAGSGKTFLAMESARREVASGKRGRLMCFNRLLGRRLAHDMKHIEGLSVGTFHKQLLRIVGLDRVPEGAAPSFWSRELPDRAMEALILAGDKHISDFLVFDEIQDVTIEPFLDVLDLLVVGGLKEGRLLFFGDFERQSVFDDTQGRERLADRAPFMATFKLMQNCRNLPRIGFQANLLCDLEPGYQQFLRQDDGVDPVFHQYLAGEDQGGLLAKAIRELKDDGYHLSEIVVLSPLRDTSTAATTGEPWLRQILEPADGLVARAGRVQYATIHAFKGLDAPAVVLTDLDGTLATENFHALLYVGLTRATDRLVALIERSTLRGAIGGTT